MKRASHCAGCDQMILLSPGRWVAGVRRVHLLLCSGRTCSVTLCEGCATVHPELLPRLWKEYVEAMGAGYTPTEGHGSLAEQGARLFQQDVPLAKLYCEPWPPVPA